MSTSFLILWNREKLSNFQLSRRLRKGNVLLPYLFVLCMKVLNQMNTTGTCRQIAEADQASCDGPPLFHLFFSAIATHSMQVLKVLVESIEKTKQLHIFFSRMRRMIYDACKLWVGKVFVTYWRLTVWECITLGCGIKCYLLSCFAELSRRKKLCGIECYWKIRQSSVSTRYARELLAYLERYFTS